MSTRQIIPIMVLLLFNFSIFFGGKIYLVLRGQKRKFLVVFKTSIKTNKKLRKTGIFTQN